MKNKIFAVMMVAFVSAFVACGGSSSSSNNNGAGDTPPAPGTLDASFGNGGIVITDFDSQIDEANAIAIQSDGKILVAGVAKITGNNNDFAIVRYNTDGTLDSSFGSNGKTTTNFGNLRNDVACAIAI